MKLRVFFLLCMIFVSVNAYAGEDAFIDALKNCSAYTSSDTMNINGVSANSYKQISGWQGDKCTYKETVNFSGNSICITCKFTKSQIEEISTVADAYYTTLKYTKEQPDLSSVESLQNNPVAQVINKYLTDPSVCSMSGL